MIQFVSRIRPIVRSHLRFFKSVCVIHRGTKGNQKPASKSVSSPGRIQKQPHCPKALYGSDSLYYFDVKRILFKTWGTSTLEFVTHVTHPFGSIWTDVKIMSHNENNSLIFNVWIQSYDSDARNILFFLWGLFSFKKCRENHVIGSTGLSEAATTAMPSQTFWAAYAWSWMKAMTKSLPILEQKTDENGHDMFRKKTCNKKSWEMSFVRLVHEL